MSAEIDKIMQRETNNVVIDKRNDDLSFLIGQENEDVNQKVVSTQNNAKIAEQKKRIRARMKQFATLVVVGGVATGGILGLPKTNSSLETKAVIEMVQNANVAQFEIEMTVSAEKENLMSYYVCEIEQTYITSENEILETDKNGLSTIVVEKLQTGKLAKGKNNIEFSKMEVGIDYAIVVEVENQKNKIFKFKMEEKP